MGIDDARKHYAWHATYSAFPGRSEAELRRVFAVVWEAYESERIATLGTDLTNSQRQEALRDHCCRLVGANEEVCRVVIVAVRELMKNKSNNGV